MADEDTPMRAADESDDSGSASESEEEQVELLVNNREKRSTAGNRLANLIQQEDPDDELELLFAEADDDAGFEDDEADSDVQMDSSDDDEDQGPAAGADDLDGEKELQKNERAAKLKKRKAASDGIPKIFKKKVRIDRTPSDASALAPRPKKKSERASWIPTAIDAPTRASARGTTRQSKEQLHAQMISREERRLKQLKNMEKAAAAKAAAKKPAMTQADRMAEAARVEKRNSKSLSRWEEAEQQREEEQAAKLLALSNRALSGPFITFWSGKAEWVGDVLKKVGKVLELEDPAEKKSRKRKAAEMEADAAATKAPAAAPPPDGGEPKIDNTPTSTTTPIPSTSASGTPTQDDKPQDEKSQDVKPQDVKPQDVKTQDVKPQDVKQPDVKPPPPNGTTAEPSRFLGMPPPPQGIITAPYIRNVSPLMVPPFVPHKPGSTPLAPPVLAPPPPYTPFNVPMNPYHALPNQSSTKPPSHPPFILAPPQQYLHYHPPPSLDGSSPLPGFGPPLLPRLAAHPPAGITPFGTPSQSQPNQEPPPPLTTAPPGPPPVSHAVRNCLILNNFSEDALKDPNTQMQIVFGRRFPKANKKKAPLTLCAIKNHPAKYRDPTTGLAYCDAAAYAEIQRIKRGDYKWSKLVGAYVGRSPFAARGVPPRFIDPNAGAARAAPKPET